MMKGWEWLTQPKTVYQHSFVLRVIVKSAVLFMLFNLVYAVAQPLDFIDSVSLYNSVIDGRERFPYADNPTEAYNISLDRLTAMFASHVVSDSGADDEIFRVFLIGDSSVWGWLLSPYETFSACLNREAHMTADNRRIEVFNLGYPVTNALKDLMILDYAMRYEPDAVVWLTTLESLYDRDLLNHAVITNNHESVSNLIAEYQLTLDASLLETDTNFLDETIIGQRRELADWLRHQMYGVMWASADFDHTNPRFFRAPMENFPDSEGIPSRDYIEIGNLAPDLLALDVLEAGAELADRHAVPLLLVNEPIFISNGINSDLRYNHLYPRWAYDAYRDLLTTQVNDNQWRFVDLWDAVPADHFTDFLPLHYDAEYTCNIANMLLPSILEMAN